MSERALLLTEPEAAEALKVCTRTLRKARQEGLLSYVLIGRAVRYTMSDLERFVERGRQEGVWRKPQARRSVRKQGEIVPFTARR